ncbi:hypothetical protein GTW37_32785 [Streptomyces sp. SID4931]|nr:hypothetical protein [Streptomyces sp. SID4931]SCG07157.1 hypothetical protein GA0115255_122277 [Streptomyces sp. Ncost-T6T-2b]
MDLNATYTYATPGFPEPTRTVRTRVRTREQDGATLTSVRGLAPLLADRIEAITDEGDRLHTLEMLDGASITISTTERTDIPADRLVTARDGGRIATSYGGTRDLPTDAVLDLAERIRDHLATDPR